MTKRKVHAEDTPPKDEAVPGKGLVVATPRDATSTRLLEPSGGAELAVQAASPMSAPMGLGATTHSIQTTMRPDVTITVSDLEYQQLLTAGLVYSGSPVTPVADSYDLLFADKVQHGTATPAALRAAFVPFWAAAETVTAGTVRVDSTGHLITRNANGTTRATYDATEQAAWTVTSSGGGGGGAVASVAGRTGVVVLSSTDLSDSTATGRSLIATASATAARTTLGLGTAATSAASAFDAAGAATTAAALRAPLLVPTATKTAAYTAAVGDLAVMNVAGGATTLTLPTAPADKAQVGFVAVGATAGTPLTVNRGGTDTVGPSGATSVTAPLANEITIYQYDAANTRWLAVANVKPLSALDGRYTVQSPSIPGSGGLVPVAGNAVTAQGTSSYSTDALRSWNTKHTFTRSCSFIVLEYTNWYPNAGSDADGPAAMTLRVGYDPNGPSNGTGILPVKWAGADTISVPAGGTVRSDPIYVDAVAGQNFWLRTTCTMATGSTYVYNTFADTGYAFAPVQDNSRSGTNYAGGNNQAVGPVRILGAATSAPARMVALVGDSIMTGANAGLSWIGGFESAVTAQGVPFVKISKGGESANNVTSLAAFTRRLALVAGCTDAIVEYATNDLLAGRTAAQVEADLITIYQRLQRLGVKRIWQTTCTPRSTSTDNFVTVANQTPLTGFGVGSAQQTFNTWVRAGGGGFLAGYIDVESVTASAIGSGLWKAAGRTITDAAITTGTKQLTSATANFTSADVGDRVVITGAGASGAVYLGAISVVTNSTTVQLSSNASTTVTGATAWLDVSTSDGTHPSEKPHQAIAALVPNFAVAP